DADSRLTGFPALKDRATLIPSLPRRKPRGISKLSQSTPGFSELSKLPGLSGLSGLSKLSGLSGLSGLSKFSKLSREYLLNLLDPFGERIYLFESVIDRERGPGRRRYSKPVHHRLGAMMAGPDRDTLAVQNGAYVVRVNSV